MVINIKYYSTNILQCLWKETWEGGGRREEGWIGGKMHRKEGREQREEKGGDGYSGYGRRSRVKGFEDAVLASRQIPTRAYDLS